MEEETIAPTWLMIKVHSTTKKKYFCKTQRTFGSKSFDNYKGSGKYWTHHIKKHGSEYVYNELVIGPYTNKEQLINLATYISESLDVVNSDEWANLRIENGIDGNPLGVVFSEELCQKISIRTSGANNPMYGNGQLISGDRNGFFNKRHTTEMLAYLSEIKKGENNPMFGKEGAKPPKCSCVICKNETTSNALVRWHINCVMDC